MNKFTSIAKSKGWQMQDIASRWGITPRQMSRIAGKPDQRDWDALAGIPLRMVDRDTGDSSKSFDPDQCEDIWFRYNLTDER